MTSGERHGHGGAAPESATGAARRHPRACPAAARVVAALLTLGLLGAPLEAADGYRIVVNASNPIGAVLESELSEMFLKKKERWETGFRVNPIDHKEDSACREAFSRSVHGKDVAAVKKYWRKMVFSGLGEPPQEMASEAAVLDFVGHNVGAVGYVCGSAGLGDLVRVLKVAGGGK